MADAPDMLQQRFEALFRALPTPATLIDAEGIVVEVNDAFIEHATRFGIRIAREDRIGRPIVSFARREPHKQDFHRFVERLLHRGQPGTWAWDTGDAEETRIGIQGVPLHDPSGALIGAVILRHDLTEKMRRGRHRDALERLRQVVWEMRRSADTSTLLDALREILHGGLLPLTHCTVARIEEADGHLAIQLCSVMDDRGFRSVPPASGSARALESIWRGGRVSNRPDLHAEDVHGERDDIDATFDKTIRSVVDVPFDSGTLAVNSVTPHAFRPEDIDFLRALTRVLEGGFQRLRDLEALERQQRLEACVSRMREAVWSMSGLEDSNLLIGAMDEALRGAGLSFHQAGINLLSRRGSETRRFNFRVGRWISVVPDGANVLEQIWQSRRVVYRRDLQRDDPYGERERLRANHRADIRCVIDVPVSIGTLALNSLEPSAFSDDDVAFLQTFAARVDDVLREGVQRLEDLSALRESQQQFERMASHVEDAIYSVDASTNEFRYLSPVFERLTGYTPGEIDARGGRIPFLESVRVGSSYTLDLKERQDSRGEEGPQRDELWITCKDGVRRCFEDRWVPVWEGDVLQSTDGVLRDITERKQAERELQIDLGLQRLRGEILLMDTKEDWPRVIRRMRDEIAEFIDFDGCGLCLVDLQAESFEAYDANQEEHKGGEARVPRALRQAVETGEPSYRRTRAQIREWGDSVGDGPESILDVPFLGGTIAVNSRQPSAFSDEDIRVLMRFAGVISEGYRRLRDLQQLADREVELRQAQKMEVIGRLAGGVAHDFNNLLSAIMSATDLALMRSRDPELRTELDIVSDAARRAASLTQQLLAFSRRQRLEPKDLPLNQTLESMSSMVRRLVGEEITVRTDFDEGTGYVRFDPGQLEQVVLNLVVNARDAMPQGGELTIETGIVDGAPASGAGRFAFLRIRDTGTGIDPEAQEHIFEPFFTTKQSGKGTGLGLSTVYGIVTQSGGSVQVASTPGLGAAFTVLVPQGEAPAASFEAGSATGHASPQGESVMIVEDEEIVRRTLERVLTHAGYRVVTAEGPMQALQLYRSSPGIDLVLADVVMPKMRGPEMLAQLRMLNPRIAGILMSGYPGEPEPEQADAFLPKPIDVSDLLGTVRRLLDARPAA
jgi:PAS domain S-box-containing protein